MSVNIDVCENSIIAHINGDIDHHTAKEIRETIDSVAERTSPQKLTLDFRGVTFMDSSGIGLVMGRYRLMNALGGQLEVINVSSQIKKVMRISGVDKIAKVKEGR